MLNYNEVKVGHPNSDHSFFSDVQLVEEIHTIKTKISGHKLLEIVFKGKNDSCTTKSTSNKGSWFKVKLEEKEIIIGIYGDYYESEYYKRFKNLGFILGKLF